MSNRQRRFWTAAEDSIIRARYADCPTKDLLADLPHRSLTTIYQRAARLGIGKSATFLASPAAYRLDGIIGTATRFPKGHVPWSKGLKVGTRGRAALTQFKPEHMPHTHVPVGTRARETKTGYWKVKVAEPNKWRWVHRMVWEAANGPIPPGHACVFKDGNIDHCDEVANLELITRQELMRRNTYHNYPQPIPQLIQLRGAITRKINRRQRREKQA